MTQQQIPVRLDFDSHAAGFAKAMAHLDNAATRNWTAPTSTRNCAS